MQGKFITCTQRQKTGTVCLGGHLSQDYLAMHSCKSLTCYVNPSFRFRPRTWTGEEGTLDLFVSLLIVASSNNSLHEFLSAFYY